MASLPSLIVGIGGGGAVVGLISLAYKLSQDHKRWKREASVLEAELLSDLPVATAANREIWLAIGRDRVGRIVEFYVHAANTRNRVNFVLDYWNRVGRDFREGRVNRLRFLPQIASDCHGTWNDFDLLIKYFEATQPGRISDFRCLHNAVEKYVKRNLRRLDPKVRKSSVSP